MQYPKVIFKPMSIDDNIEIIKWALFEKDSELNIRNLTLSFFPELSKINFNSTDELIDEKIKSIVEKYYNKSIEKIRSEVERYNQVWSNYNDKYFSKLYDYFNVSLPKSLSVIEASVGLIPIFPRNIDDFTFSITIGIDEIDLINISAHEILHFIWFEKWKELHPETSRKHFDSPYLEWKYSEMVTDPILNNEPFNKIFDFKEKGYDCFYELYDNDELVMDKLRNIYSSSLTVEDKIEKGFNYLKKYFDVYSENTKKK